MEAANEGIQNFWWLGVGVIGLVMLGMWSAGKMGKIIGLFALVLISGFLVMGNRDQIGTWSNTIATFLADIANIS